MEEIRIREASGRDVLHLVRHRRAMFVEMGNTDEAVLQRVSEVSERYFREALADGGYRGWMAENESGRVVSGGGIVIVRWPANPDFLAMRRGWLLNIYTDLDYRHRGIAKRVMAAILEWCRADGFFHVSLHASQFGRELYEQLGFRPTNEMRLYL